MYKHAKMNYVPSRDTRDTVVLHLKTDIYLYMTPNYLSCLTSAEHFSSHSVWPTYPSHIIPVQSQYKYFHVSKKEILT